MAVGWAGDNAVNDQITDSIQDEIARVQRLIPQGESLTECEDCGEPIPDARRKALPGVRRCLHCQEEFDNSHVAISIFNRKGSKDSQLR
jgi:phage/conjugal plasmid C-4 type zinc finger TraR family protein